MFCEHNVLKNACLECFRTENARLKREIVDMSNANALLRQWVGDEKERVKVRASAAAKGGG